MFSQRWLEKETLWTNHGAPSFCLGFLDKLLEEHSVLIVTEGAAFLVL